jgi:ferredoxin-NADP reductase
MKDKKLNKEEILQRTPNERELVMYDSNEHTYDEAIDAIWIATGHNELQCEQLAVLIDTKGFATIKIGHIEELQPMAETIQLEGFKVMIY